jgi:hypothetical protein
MAKDVMECKLGMVINPPMAMEAYGQTIRGDRLAGGHDGRACFKDKQAICSPSRRDRIG